MMQDHTDEPHAQDSFVRCSLFAVCLLLVDTDLKGMLWARRLLLRIRRLCASGKKTFALDKKTFALDEKTFDLCCWSTQT